MIIREQGEMASKKPYCITIIGGLGAGKSSYGMTRIDVPSCFKLGVYDGLGELKTLNMGGGRRHEEDNRRIGIDYKRTNLSTIVQDIAQIKKPQLFIDEWPILFYQFSFFCPEERISRKAQEIFSAINSNKSLELAVFICGDIINLNHFRRHKKKALWIKELVKASDEVVRVEFGIPEKIKGVY